MILTSRRSLSAKGSASWLRLALPAATCFLTHLAAAPAVRLSIAAADVDRAGVVVSATLPVGASRAMALSDGRGRSIPVQIDETGRAWFVVTELKAGASETFTLEANAPAAPQVTAVVERGRLRVAIAGAPLLDYQMDKEALPRAGIEAKFKRAGYLHPIFTPAGAAVTEDYPSNHVHHHGAWAAWPKTTFQNRTPNFWEMAEQTGTVEFVAIDRTWAGPVHGGFVARQRFLDLSASPPTPVLDETWELTAYALEPAGASARMFDLAITQACASPEPLLLPKFHYGGFGFRGQAQWDGKGRLTVMTSEGETDRTRANGTRVRWCYIGSVDQPATGVAILCHPENFRAPQPIRVHPDMPFVCFAPSHLGDWAIEPGRPHVARYRILALDGPPDRTRLEAFWHGYAQATVAMVETR